MTFTTVVNDIDVNSGGSWISQKVRRLSFDKIFAENCMKIKEIGPKGGYVPSAPLDLPIHQVSCCVSNYE